MDFKPETYVDSENKQIVAVPSIKIKDKVETNKTHSFNEEGDCDDPSNNDDPSYKTNSSEDDTDDEEYFPTKDGATGSRLPSVDDDSDFSCQICFRNYSSRRSLIGHMRRHRDTTKHVCPHCGVAKVTRTELQTHLRVHLPNVEKFPCPQCPQVFRHKNAISRHVKVVHEGQRQYCCDYCPKRFSTRNAKVGHERLHTGERPFSCKECGKEFVKQETLRTHMKNHNKNLRTHICSYCSQRFITLRNLINHEQRHKGDKPHICHICSKGFSRNEDLQFHLSTFHPNRMEEEYDIDSQNTN